MRGLRRLPAPPVLHVLLASATAAACVSSGDPPPFQPPPAGLDDAGTYQPVPGSCGLDAPAFCDTFEAPPRPAGGRAGELDPARWSGVRGGPWGHASLADAFAVGPALVPECRAGRTGTLVLPGDDALICDPTAQIPTRHLLTATAAQNYGLSTYRIRQPFDFAGRTGTIKLDLEIASGWGWPAIVIAQDPSAAPSLDWEERGSGPQNGVEVEFDGGWCGAYDTIRPNLYLFRDHVQTGPVGKSDDCSLYATTAPGALNHVEIYLTQQHLEVWASDASPDGVAFPHFHLLWAGDVDLPFTRAYVSLVGRNHATIKYWAGASWIGRWDNVGFDGPEVTTWREHSVPEPLTVTHGLPGCKIGGVCEWRGQTIADHPDDDSVCSESCDFDGEGRNVGYVVPRSDEPPARLTIPGVRLDGVVGARLSLAADYPWFEWGGMFPAPTQLDLRHRLNGGPWHDRFISDVEVNAFANYFPDVLTGPGGAGLLNQMITLDPAELREGDNVLELSTSGTWTGDYRVGVVGVDLVLSTSATD
jgi:hypothetical protein